MLSNIVHIQHKTKQKYSKSKEKEAVRRFPLHTINITYLKEISSSHPNVLWNKVNSIHLSYLSDIGTCTFRYVYALKSGSMLVLKCQRINWQIQMSHFSPSVYHTFYKLHYFSQRHYGRNLIV